MSPAPTRGNGKRNGKPKKHKVSAKSLANLRAPIKKGEVLNPNGINGQNRKRTWQEECELWYDETEEITLPNGDKRMLTRREMGVRLAGRRVLAGLQPGADYDPMVKVLLDRVWPVPCETGPPVNVVTVQQNTSHVTQVAFLDEVRARAGSNTIGVQDVLDTLNEYIDQG